MPKGIRYKTNALLPCEFHLTNHIEKAYDYVNCIACGAVQLGNSIAEDIVYVASSTVCHGELKSIPELAPPLHALWLTTAFKTVFLETKSQEVRSYMEDFFKNEEDLEYVSEL